MLKGKVIRVISLVVMLLPSALAHSESWAGRPTLPHVGGEIATQGNQALRDIRAEARLALPALPARGMESAGYTSAPEKSLS